MNALNAIELNVIDVVDRYISARKTMPISTTHALSAIRDVLPECGLTDRALVEMVATQAIKQGSSVAFEQVSVHI